MNKKVGFISIFKRNKIIRYHKCLIATKTKLVFGNPAEDISIGSCFKQLGKLLTVFF